MKRTLSVDHALWVRWGILAVLVAAAAWLWFAEGRTEQRAVPGPVQTPAVIVPNDARLKREASYEKDVAALQALIESGAADEATQEMAAKNLAELIEEHTSEIALESALEEAGFAGAAVIVQNGAVTVMLPDEQLSEKNSAQIISLCIAHTDAKAENVRVMGLHAGTEKEDR